MSVFGHDLISLVAYRLIFAFKEQKICFYARRGRIATFKKYVAASHATEFRHLTVRVGSAGKLPGFVDVRSDYEGQGENTLNQHPYGIGLKKHRAGGSYRNRINYEEVGTMALER